MRTWLAVLLGIAPLAVGLLVWRRSRWARGVPASRIVLVSGLGFVLAWASHWAQAALWEWTGLSLSASEGRASEALLATFSFAAPLEEGAKVLCIWPLYTTRRLLFVRHGVVLAAAAALGFAAGEGVVQLLEVGSGLQTFRVLLASPAHVAAAIIWGATLGARTATGGFAVSWLLATALHGVFDHVLFGRGPGLMVLTAPLLLTLTCVAYVAVRRAKALEAERSSLTLGASAAPLASAWSEPASVREIWQGLKSGQQPLMLFWVVAGALVTAGTGLVSLAAGLWLGHLVGLDFAAADEADVRSNGPLLFLAAAVGLAFPVAGYLLARASGTRSVLEPALGAALAVLGTVVLLSITAPIAAVFALAITPIAFALASSGAWFGISR